MTGNELKQAIEQANGPIYAVIDDKGLVWAKVTKDAAVSELEHHADQETEVVLTRVIGGTYFLHKKGGKHPFMERKEEAANLPDATVLAAIENLETKLACVCSAEQWPTEVWVAIENTLARARLEATAATMFFSP